MRRGMWQISRGTPAPDLATPLWLAQLLAAAGTVLFTLAMDTTGAAPACLAVPGSMLGALAAQWPDRSMPRTTAFGATAAAHVLIVMGVAAAMGESVWRFGLVAVVSLVNAVLVGVMHRRVSAGWAPRTAAEVLRVAAWAVAVSPLQLVAWLALDPNPHTLVSESHLVLLRAAGGMVVGLTTIFPAISSPPPAARVGGLRTWAICAVMCLIPHPVLLAAPNLPLSWVFVVGPLVAALVLSPRALGLLMFLMCVVQLAMPYPQYHPGRLSWLPAVVFLDLLVAFASLVALLVAVGRDHLARLAADVADAVAEEQERIELLSTVYASMSDGLVLADPQGAVTMSNPAAARLIGRPVPAKITEAWAAAAELQVEDARRIAGVTLPGTALPGATALPVATALPGAAAMPTHSAALPAAGTPSELRQVPRHREVVVPLPTGERRRLSVSHLPLGVGGRDLSLHLLTDITAEHARQHDLESFAGTVAHDLRGPLAALTGWLETAQDELRALDVASGEAAVGRPWVRRIACVG